MTETVRATPSAVHQDVDPWTRSSHTRQIARSGALLRAPRTAVLCAPYSTVPPDTASRTTPPRSCRDPADGDCATTRLAPKLGSLTWTSSTEKPT